MSMLFFLFCEWFESCLVNLHGVIIGCTHHMFGLQHGWHELLQCWWWFLMFLLLTFKKSITTTHSLHNCLTQGHGIRHGQQKVFHISMKSKRNWFKSVAASHEMSHASCLNLEAYTKARCVPWWRVCNLFVDVRFLSESLKEAPN
jgi:hypothetical protein